MNTAVITGSSRGFGFCQAKKFRELGWNVVLSATNQDRLNQALFQLNEIKRDKAGTLSVICDVRKEEDLQRLWELSKAAFGSVDIWVNNAGVNNPDKPVCEMTEKEIGYILDVDLKGAVLGSKIAFAGMKKQGFGQIYNTEGYGSNDAMMTGLTIYGTAKRALTYFSHALAKESHELTADSVKVCRLTPGIMITEFLTSANAGESKITLSEKTKKIYNILGDYPETIADYCVPRMVANKKNDASIVWLTGGRAFNRFLTSGIKKRDFFSEKEMKK